MQQIAAENNLSETAFFVAVDDNAEADYQLRWFTPTTEVDLCGHATLATSHYIFNIAMQQIDSLKFSTLRNLIKWHYSCD